MLAHIWQSATGDTMTQEAPEYAYFEMLPYFRFAGPYASKAKANDCLEDLYASDMIDPSDRPVIYRNAVYLRAD
jgi:hypothetical protein